MSYIDGILGSIYYTAINGYLNETKNLNMDIPIIGFAGGYLGGYILNQYLPSPYLGSLIGVFLFDYLLFI